MNSQVTRAESREALTPRRRICPEHDSGSDGGPLSRALREPPWAIPVLLCVSGAWTRRRDVFLESAARSAVATSRLRRGIRREERCANQLYRSCAGLCEWLEVGFNTFYTYRQGETAWIYARALRCLSALTGATTISVYPYQIGQNNEEGIDSGAFWFYRKLGFRSGSRDLEQLARREEGKIAANSAIPHAEENAEAFGGGAHVLRVAGK